MKTCDLLELYIRQLLQAGKNISRPSSEIRKYLRYCERNVDGHVNYGSLQSWMKIRADEVNEATYARVQNTISKFTEWASIVDDSVGLIPKYGPIRVKRRKPVILEANQVDEISLRLEAFKHGKGITPKTSSIITRLLFVSGMRIGEALNLHPSSIDFVNQSIYVPSGKGFHDRVIPISHSTLDVLSDYLDWKKRLRPNSECFFIFDKPNIKHPYTSYSRHFSKATQELGYKRLGNQNDQLKIHDLRHSFAVNSLIKIYESGEDVNEAIVQLSSILGHSVIEHTYWYIECVPKLSAAAFERMPS